MCRTLPEQPSIVEIEKEARTLLIKVSRRHAVAVARWHSIDSEAYTFQPRLADVRYIIAREYGFSSWQKLKEQLTSSGSERQTYDVS